MSNINFDDNALVSRAKSGDSEALYLLIERYSEKIKVRSRSFKNLRGIECEDLYQEGMLGFVAAVYSYDDTRDASFSTYASTLTVRRMLSALRRANNKSNLPLHSYVSLEHETDLLSYSPTPEDMVIFNEELDGIYDFVEKNFSKSEKKVFKLYILGLSYSEISDVLECEQKFVDNALQRIRKKLRKLK